MREVLTEGVICVLDEQTHIEYALCDITLAEREDGSTRWVFRPRWGVIDLVGPPLFQGIPGLNLDLRLPEYVRENRTPVFVSERVPAENREDAWELLSREGMDYLNKLEWLIRTSTRYSGDALYVRRRSQGDAREIVEVGDLATVGARSASAIRYLLEALASGAGIHGEGFEIIGPARKDAHAVLRLLYLKEKRHLDALRSEGLKRAAAEGREVGRKPLPVDEIALAYAVERFEGGLISAQEAADELGVSRATFFRRRKGLGR